MNQSNPLLEVEHLVKHFPITSGIVFKHRIGAVQAVDDVSFSLTAGETMAVVGESGCGKSTLARAVLRLIEPSSGRVEFDGTNIIAATGEELRRVRRQMQIVFQDPYASLNPRMTVGTILAEPFVVNGLPHRDRVPELLETVGLAPEHEYRYPHEFSGGQRQRVGIARALALEPKLVVCDEPVSALDVSVRGQILNLLQDLQDRYGLSYLFISHDLSVVRHLANRVAVMYLGRFVETAAAAELFDSPRHPYTRSLISAVPIPDPAAERRRTPILLTGDVPSPANPPSGCRFRTRCPKLAAELTDAQAQRCRDEDPALTEGAPGHAVACHYA